MYGCSSIGSRKLGIQERIYAGILFANKCKAVFCAGKGVMGSLMSQRHVLSFYQLQTETGHNGVGYKGVT